MRISELSERTGIPVPRIKYYIREGLLPRGSGEQAKRAEYDESHARRLRLIRALVSVGGMPVAQARQVLQELDAPSSDPLGLLDLIFGSLAERAETREDPAWREAESRLDRVLERHGWRSVEDDPARLGVVRAMATMIELGHGSMLDHLGVYASAAEQVAEADLGSIRDAEDLTVILERSVVGSLLGETFFAGLRRIAHGNIARRRIETGSAPFDEGEAGAQNEAGLEDEGGAEGREKAEGEDGSENGDEAESGDGDRA